jgi:hypothetical protein
MHAADKDDPRLALYAGADEAKSPRERNLVTVNRTGGAKTTAGAGGPDVGISEC